MFIKCFFNFVSTSACRQTTQAPVQVYVAAMQSFHSEWGSRWFKSHPSRTKDIEMVHAASLLDTQHLKG